MPFIGMTRAFAGAIVAAALLGPVAASAQQPVNLVTYGPSIESWTKLYFDPFTAKTGTPVRVSAWNNNLAVVQAMVDAKNVTWDVVDMGGESIGIACERGLIVPLDYKVMGGRERFVEGATHDCGIASFMSASGFAFDANSFPGAKPSRIEDVFDVARFPGKRTFRLSPIFTFEFAALADGVAPDKMYEVLATPDGVARVFKKLEQIKDQIVWNSSGAQAVQLLLDREVVLSQAAWDIFKNAGLRTNRPIEFIWDGSARVSSYWSIVKGTPNFARAQELIAFMNDPEVQGRWGEVSVFHSPPVKAAMDKIPEARAKLLATHPDNANKRHYINSVQFWADYREEYELRLNKWLGR